MNINHSKVFKYLVGLFLVIVLILDLRMGIQFHQWKGLLFLILGFVIGFIIGEYERIRGAK